MAELSARKTPVFAALGMYPFSKNSQQAFYYVEIRKNIMTLVFIDDRWKCWY